MTDTVDFARPLSIVTLFTLLPLTNAVAQDERIRQIDRRVLDPAPAVVAEADIPPPPAELSKAAKLQFLEQVVAQPRMQAMSGSFTGLEADLLAKLVKLSPVFLLTPKNPFASRVISGKEVPAWLEFYSAAIVNASQGKFDGYASLFCDYNSGLLCLDDDDGNDSTIMVKFRNLPPNTLYLLDISLYISGAGEFQLDSMNSTICWIDFLHAPKEFALQKGSHHALAILEQLTTPEGGAPCRLRLRLKNQGSLTFYSLQVTEP